MLVSITKITTGEKATCFSFTELEDLFSACTQLECGNKNSSVYKHGGKYVLIMVPTQNDIYILCEYGNILKLYPEIIYEHGACFIKDNAINIIQAYFS